MEIHQIILLLILALIAIGVFEDVGLSGQQILITLNLKHQTSDSPGMCFGNFETYPDGVCSPDYPNGPHDDPSNSCDDYGNSYYFECRDCCLDHDGGSNCIDTCFDMSVGWENQCLGYCGVSGYPVDY